MTVQTKQKRQVVDITDKIAETLPTGTGIVTVFIKHTTAALTTADLDPGTDQDFLDFLDAITPSIKWRHPHDPSHTPDHLLASTIGPSVTLPYANGQLLLGTWQRIILVEFDGPRQREIVISAVKTTS